MVGRAEAGSPKPRVWIGDSKLDLMALPAPVVDTFGYALFLAQIGKRHGSTRILRGFGDASVIEIKESYRRCAYRAVYTVRFDAAVFVLHVFAKKSKSGVKTTKRDVALINARLNYAARVAKVM
jgi:phage-related protein